MLLHQTDAQHHQAQPLPWGWHNPHTTASTLHLQPPASLEEWSPAWHSAVLLPDASASSSGKINVCSQSRGCHLSIHQKPESHQPRQWRHIPGGAGAGGSPLERRGALEGEPVRAAERGRSLLRTQEFRFLAGVHGGVHVIRVVSRLVPASLVGGLGHDGFVALAGHQGAAKAIRNRAERAVFWKAGGRLRVAAAFYHSNNQSKRLYLNLASSLFKHAFHYKERPFHMP